MCLFCKLYRYKLWDMNANTLPPPPPPRIRSVRPPITFYIGAKLLTQISPLPRNNKKEKKLESVFLKEFLHVVICNLCDSSSKLYFKNNLPFQICLQDWQVAKCKKQQHQRGFMNWKIVQLTCSYNVKFLDFSPHYSFKEYCTNNGKINILLFKKDYSLFFKL